MRQFKITRSVTQRDNVALEKYLNDISKIDLITPEEEVNLAQKIREGDSKALEKLTNANLRFVVSVAKQFQNQGLTLADTINEGNLGLIKAAQRFDETKGFKFISYAVWWIRQSIMQAIAEKSRLVRLPMNKIGSIQKLNQVFNELEQEYEREPTPLEVAQIFEVDEWEINSVIGINYKHVSVDSPLGENEDGTMLDTIPNKNAQEADQDLVYNESLHVDLERLLTMLPSKHAKVIKMYYGLDSTNAMGLETIADFFGMGKERIRQIRDEALKMMRKHQKSQLLQKYLGT